MRAFDDSGTSAQPRPHPGAVDSHEHDRQQGRAHTFFWCILIAAATVSITGNATHAVIHATALPAIAAAVAIVPPATLLAAVHGVAVLIRAHATAPAVRLVATGMTLLIAAAAFRLSFTALRALALLAGVPAGEAWLWPLIVEGSMTQATIALLALAHSHRREQVPSQRNTDHDNGSAHAPRADDHLDRARLVENNPTVRTTGPHASPVWSWAELAETICDRDPARRRDPHVVADVLARYYEQRRTPTQIAREIRRSRSAVSRIISAAEQLDPQDFGTYTITRRPSKPGRRADAA